MGRNWSPEQRQAAAERMRQMQLRRSAVKLTPKSTLNTETKNGVSAIMIAEPIVDEKLKKKYMPYVGSDELPYPKDGEVYGDPRFYADSNNLIRVRKKIIKDTKSSASGYVVVRDSVTNVVGKKFRKSELFVELKKCGIPGVN